MTTTDEPLASGETLPPVAGRYELGPVIGVGSSAVVRHAHDQLTGDAVAVKVFHSGASPHDRRQQRAEMESLSQLHHAGLVGLHDGGVTDGRPYLVMDLVEGPSLAERIACGPVPARQVCRVGADLAAALDHVHGQGFVHRDVKPANVLLGDGTGCRLTDFGIARAIDSSTDTEAGSVVGTAAYLAPEQARGEVVGPPADIYALGLVLLESITGKREYPGKAVESAAARLHRSPVVPDELDHELSTLLRAMTVDDPAARPTAAVVAATLAPLACDGPIDVDLAGLSRPASPAGAVPAPRHALPDGIPAVPVAADGSGPRHSLDEPIADPAPDPAFADPAVVGSAAVAETAAVPAQRASASNPGPAVRAAAYAGAAWPDAVPTGALRSVPPRVDAATARPVRVRPDGVRTVADLVAASRAEAAAVAAPAGLAGAPTPAPAELLVEPDRKYLPRKVVAPLAALVLLSAGVWGSMALLAPLEQPLTDAPAVEAGITGPTAGLSR